MLTTLPAQMLGASLSAATAGALLDVAGFLIFAVVVWAIFISSAPGSAPPTHPTPLRDWRHSRRQSWRWWGLQSPASPLAPLQTAMLPLEVDLARVETLPVLSAVPAPSAAPAPVSIVDELRADMSELSDDASSAHPWPPVPRTRGAKVYRYVNVGGRLVKLSDLRTVLPLPPSGNMLN